MSIVIRAVNQASGELRKVANQINAVHKEAGAFREAAGNLAITGGLMLGAGGGIAYGLKSIVGPAMEVEDQLHRLRNTLDPGVAGMKELAAAQKATASTSTTLGIAQEGLLKQVYLGTSAGLSMADSIQAMNVASRVAQGMGGDLEATQRTLNLAFINFKDPSKTAAQNIQQLGDVMAYATAKFDYKNVEELRSQLELATPTALSAGMGFKDLVATLADFTRHGLTGSVAGEALEESLHGVLQMQEKLGIPLSRNAQGGVDLARSLTNVRQHFTQLYGSMKAIPVPVLQEIQKTFGERGLRALLIDKDEFNSMRTALDGADVAGAAKRFSDEMLKSPQEQFKVFSENMRQVLIQLGYAILPVMVGLAQALKPVAKAAIDFAKAHQGWVKMAAVAAMITSAVLLLGGGLALAGAALMGFVGFLPTLLAFSRAISLMSALTKLWTAAQWLLNVALDANPIGLLIIALVGVGVAIGYMINHWQAVKDFLKSSLVFFGEVGSYVFHALVDPFIKLPGMIRSAWPRIKSAVMEMAGSIGRFFVGHSPIPEGPLHDLDLGREISRSLRPKPVINAVRAAAAAVAMVVPTMAPAVRPAFAGPIPTIAPATARSAFAGPNPGNIVIHSSPTIIIKGEADDPDLEARILAILSKHDEQLLKRIEALRIRKERLEF